MEDKIDYFALLLIMCISISCCSPGNHGVERRLDKINQEIHTLNESITQLTNKGGQNGNNTREVEGSFERD